MVNKLPNKPSALIRVALVDVKLCRKDPRYKLSMGCWHSFNSYTGKCSICLAGSVVAQTLKKSYKLNIIPEDCNSVEMKLRAIDRFRTGRVESGLIYLGYEFQKLIGFKPPRWRKTQQGYSPAYLGRLADEFERCGL